MRKRNEMKWKVKKERGRSLCLHNNFCVLLAIGHVIRQIDIAKCREKKKTPKDKGTHSNFCEWWIYCLNLVIDLPELSESYECAMNACMLRCNVAFFFSRLFARRMLKIQSHLTFIHCLFGQMLHRGLDTISRARLPSSLHTHLIYVYHRYFYYYYLTALIWSPLATYWMVAHTQHSNIRLNNGSI